MLNSNPVRKPTNYVSSDIEDKAEGLERVFSVVEERISYLNDSILLAQSNFDYLERKLVPYSKPLEKDGKDKCESACDGSLSPFTIELISMQDRVNYLADRIKFVTERLEI